jgi:hypothetical protein
MSPEGFEPAIPENERPQTHALDLAVSGTGKVFISIVINKLNVKHGIPKYDKNSQCTCMLGGLDVWKTHVKQGDL